MVAVFCFVGFSTFWLSAVCGAGFVVRVVLPGLNWTEWGGGEEVRIFASVCVDVGDSCAIAGGSRAGFPVPGLLFSEVGRS